MTHFEDRHRELRKDAIEPLSFENVNPDLWDFEERTGPLVDDLVAAVRAMDDWLGRASQFVNAVVVMADDRAPGLSLLADMAMWNDQRKRLLAALDEVSDA